MTDQATARMGAGDDEAMPAKDAREGAQGKDSQERPSHQAYGGNSNVRDMSGAVAPPPDAQTSKPQNISRISPPAEQDSKAGARRQEPVAAQDAPHGKAVPPSEDTPQPGETSANWRDKFAGEDGAFRKRLERFADEAAFAKSYRALEQKLSSGDFKRGLPDNTNAEEIAAWRAENGIPDSASAYLDKLALPHGLVLGEAERPVAEDFARRALEENWTPQQFNDAVSWYYENLDMQQALRADADAQYHHASDLELRAEWGVDYRRVVNAANGFIGKHFPGGLGEEILAARDSEGRMLGDNPHFVRALAQLAREMNPYATLVPAAGAAARGGAARVAEIETLMGDPNSAYWKGAEASALQQEYRDLVSKER